MSVTGKTRIAGVIGNPISHSRSPLLHGLWLEHYGIDGALVPLQVKADDLTDVIKTLPKLGLVGTCVTIPHKEAVMGLVDELDPTARSIGAVNVTTVEQGGRLVGQNTDAFGFIENIKDRSGWAPTNRPASILGAGGAARAVLYGLSEAGVGSIRLVNRTRQKAETLARDLSPHISAQIEIWDWQDRAKSCEGAGLLVNTTSLGMTGQPGLDMALDHLPQEALVTDIVYTPLLTPLLLRAQDRGHPIVDGLGMLIHQARPAFQKWFGRDPEVTADIRAALETDIQG